MTASVHSIDLEFITWCQPQCTIWSLVCLRELWVWNSYVLDI